MALSIEEIQQNLGNPTVAEQFIQEQGGSITIDGVAYTSGREAFSAASTKAQEMEKKAQKMEKKTQKR